MKEMNNEIRKELAEAIITVLRTTYKKEAREAFKLVESSGYTVYKSDGFWYVRNDKTFKTVSLHRYYKPKFGAGNTVSLSGYGVADLSKLNLLAYLEKPFNQGKYEYDYAPSVGKMRELKSRKWWLQEEAKGVEKYEAQLKAARERYLKEYKRLIEFRAKNGLLK